MDEVARWPASDRADLFAAAASRRGIMPAIMEKDFWVCWTLRRVFTIENPPTGLIFKGGTSLSKVFNAIERFSEDVDLSLNRSDMGFGGDDDPMMASSGKKRQRALDGLSAECRDLVTGPIHELLNQECRAALVGGTEPWELIVADSDPFTLLFYYPRTKEAQTEAAYVRPMVRLEFGARSDHWPAQDATIISYIAEEFPEQVATPESKVRVLSGARTFWEKATILHQWYHAPTEKPFPDRQSRHFYDLACLSTHPIGEAALKDFDLLSSVAKHKTVFFSSAWSRYDLAKPGTLRLLPASSRMKALQNDYTKMQEMIFGRPKPLDEVLSTLGLLEERVNSTAP